MLAYYLEWHMRRALAPILFDDHDRAAGAALRASPVAKAQPSPAARRKARIKQTDDGLPVHSFRSLLADLATLTRNTVRFGRAATFPVLATPTKIQRRALDLLGLQPARSQDPQQNASHVSDLFKSRGKFDLTVLLAPLFAERWVMHCKSNR
jgi:hypothetical protein